MQLKFYPIDVSYRVIRDIAVLHLFGRAFDGSQVCVIDESFEPYFWMTGADREEIEALSVKRIDAEIRVKRVEVHRKKFIGKEVNALKVFASLPSDIPILRESARRFGNVFEADFLFPRRYMVDRNITPLSLYEAEGEFVPGFNYKVPVFRASSISRSGEDMLPSFRVLSLDIETHSAFGKGIVPEEQPIIMLALAGDNFRKVITWKRFKTDLDYVEFVGSELELIESFKRFIADYRPDIVAGYYSDGFDFPYLASRAEKYKIQLDLGLDNSPLRIMRRQNPSAEITGMIHFDVFMFVRKIFGRSMETGIYDLNSVASEILDEGKEKVDLADLYDAWNNNDGLERFCSYNLQDAVLTLKLAGKLLPNLIELVKVVGLSVFDVSRMSFSQLVEWHLIGEARNFNEMVPNKPEFSESRQRIERTYEGAFVFKPTPGLYRDVAVFDFRSLYPTIISAHNISPETMNCECCTGQDIVPGEKMWFCRKRKGFISTVIESLIIRRMRIKEIMKSSEKSKMLKAREGALKTIANSMYGYMGFFAARWYCLDCARSITAFGRHYITEVIGKAEKNGFKVIYSDTDSIFIALSGKSRYDAEHFVDEINRSLPGLMEMESQGFYPCGLFVGTKDKGLGAKKKYALLGEDGSVRIRGFETVRRNLSLVSKEVQETVLGIILRENDVEKALGYAKETIEAIRRREVPLEKMIIRTQL
ncbi:ribonuclease H-like domain-containing protein, partial [Candidatus Woesearchaeota archaeon]|nr:ribonuclease H-like domain-containing protein [Candidatus Woesearchaeota archaeon]